MVLVKDSSSFSVLSLESAVLEDLARCLVFLVDAIGAQVLDARVYHGPSLVYAVKINTSGYSTYVVESLCKFSLKHIEPCSMFLDQMYEESVLDAECGWVSIKGSESFFTAWNRLLNEIKYIACSTFHGIFWSRDAFETRRVYYERCRLLVFIQMISNKSIDLLM